MLYFASSIITSVDKEAREEDADELRDELAADLEELDAERDRLVEATRKLSVDYVPEDDDFVDDVDEDERMTAEEVDEEIADIYEEFNERKALRQDAFDAFMKIEPKQLVPDEALYQQMRPQLSSDYHGRHGRRIRARPAGRHGPGRDGRRAARRYRQRQGPEARQGHQTPGRDAFLKSPRNADGIRFSMSSR